MPTQTQSPADLPSTSNGDSIRPFGQYFLVRKLAEGGMAEIFVAKQVGAEGFERNVVIKRMLQHLSSVPDFVGMFLDEARLASRLAHQNIVQINDLGLADGCYYISMEYLAGEDFSTILRTASRRREYVPLHVAVRVMIEAANGLHFAHDFTDETGKPLHIVHRDISPSNILVTYQGQVKLLDFGIAKAESRVTQTTAGVVKGKYMYMSPEQARSDQIDRRADVFSLGVSLYEALTNTRPFARDSDLGILNAVLNGDFRPPRILRPDLPPELESIVLKAMSSQPDRRYQTAGAFAADLERFLAASTSQTGGTAVAVYLHALFGEDRIASKTRIPSLSSLSRSIPIAGFDPDAKTRAANPPVEGVPVLPSEAATVNKSQTDEPGTRVKARRLWPLGLVTLVAVGLATLAWLRLARTDPPSPPAAAPEHVAETAPVAAPSPAVATAPTPVPPAETPQPRAVVPVEPPVEHRAVKPIVLDAAGIQNVVNHNRAAIMRCFDSYKQELPSDDGKVTVTLTILGSGKVTGAAVAGDLKKTKVGSCLEDRVSKLRFPINKDKEITFGLPIEYHVKR